MLKRDKMHAARSSEFVNTAREFVMGIVAKSYDTDARRIEWPTEGVEESLASLQLSSLCYNIMEVGLES